MPRLAKVLFLLVLVLLLVPAVSLAATGSVPSTHLILPVSQIWVVVVGLFAPLIGYITNTTLWRNAPEPVKAFVQVLIAAISAAITTAISTSVFGFNNATLQLIVTGVFTALAAHSLLWKPSGVQAHLTTPPSA
jgi:hypothetical protein